MRRAGLWILTLAVGCGDPNLDLSFQIPAAYTERVEQVILRIYEPRDTSPFDCEALAFAEVEAGVLQGSLVDESRLVGAEVAPLVGLERAGAKIFYAEGRDAAGEPWVVGCVEVPELDGETPVRIRGVPVAQRALVDRPRLSRTLGEALDGPVIVRVTDRGGLPLAGVSVQWALDGAGGVASQGDASTDGLGEVAIRPALPAQPGPFAVRARVRWATPGPPLATGFVAAPPQTLTLPGRVLEYRQGQIGPDGEPGLVGLVQTEDDGRRVVFLFERDGEVVVQSSPDVPGVQPRLGLFDFRDGPDRVVVVSDRTWVEISPDGIFTPRDYRPPVAATGAVPRVVLPSGPCFATPDTPNVLVTYDANAVGFYDIEANLTGGFSQNLDVVASGCVDDQAGVAIRTLVIDGGVQVGLVVAAEVESNLYVSQPWVAVGTGTAFSPRVGDTPRLLLGTQLNVNEFVVSRASWRREGETVALKMEGLDSPPEIPSVNRGGDIDGDGALDVVSLFARQVVPTDPVRWFVWSVLGREDVGDRMAGTFDLGADPLTEPSLWLVDFDGDGVDDMVVAERSSPLNPLQRASRVRVYRMGPP